MERPVYYCLEFGSDFERNRNMVIERYKKCDECGVYQQLEPIRIGYSGRWIEVNGTGFTDEALTGIHHYCSIDCLRKAIN
ncbi:MAG: hypothetical protein GY931_21370 [Maribacter sp.]|nr:hypothetical protein [Maribacter sp.]